MKLVVTSATSQSARIRAFRLDAADGQPLPSFTAGAHLDLALGMGESRSYSLCNDPADPTHYRIAVLREQPGTGGSAWMHDVLAVGETLQSPPPINNFPLNESGAHHLLIAGGIGITPIMAMAYRLQALGRDYAIHYCARSHEEAAFVDELSAAHGERLHLYFDGGDIAKGLDVIDLLRTRTPGGHAYVCGPAGLIRAVRAAGAEWPVGTVHHELFGGSIDDPADGAGQAPFDVVLKRSGRQLTVAAGQSLLDALRAADVKVKSLCKTGTCGTCYVGVISGAVDHRDDCLGDDDRETGMQACVSRAIPGETLVLDL